MPDKLLRNEEIIGLKPLLDEWVDRIERPSYIPDDPVLFMHAFDQKEDQEIAGFFAALMAWGRRDIIIKKVHDLLNRMDYRPYEFVRNFGKDDRSLFQGFKHRTFKDEDIFWLVTILHRILNKFTTFESFWEHCNEKARNENRELMELFPGQFFSYGTDAPRRTRKHISDAGKNSACKRLYLYLRWNIRKNSSVDPGIMKFIDPSELKIPLDIHVARQARSLGLLERKYNDWKAAVELTQKLKLLDSSDPVKYDYALFGMGLHT